MPFRLLWQDMYDTGQARGSPASHRWRAEVIGPTPAPQLVLQAYVQAVTAPTTRLWRLEQARHDGVKTWRLAPVVLRRYCMGCNSTPLRFLVSLSNT
jgi:hypothetical protein